MTAPCTHCGAVHGCRACGAAAAGAAAEGGPISFSGEVYLIGLLDGILAGQDFGHLADAFCPRHATFFALAMETSIRSVVKDLNADPPS